MCTYIETWAFQVVLVIKNLPANAGGIKEAGSIPGSGRSSGGGNATHSSIPAWRIPWTEEPCMATVHTVTKSQVQLKPLSMHAGKQKRI